MDIRNLIQIYSIFDAARILEALSGSDEMIYDETERTERILAYGAEEILKVLSPGQLRTGLCTAGVEEEVRRLLHETLREVETDVPEYEPLPQLPFLAAPLPSASL